MRLTAWEKMKLFQLVVHVVAAGGIAFAFDASWLLASIACWFFIYLFGGTIGYHRIWSHRSFQPSNFVRYGSMWVGMLMGQGAVFSWVGQHRMHHRYSDISRDKDPYWAHCDTALGTLKTWFLSPHPINYELNMVKDLVRDKWVRFTHEHYYKIMFSWIAALVCVSPKVALYCWFIPSVMCYVSAQVTGVFGHKIGVLHYPDTHDHSRDSHWLNIFTLGESYQNFHHKYPTRVVMGKYDLSGWVIEKFLARKGT